MFLSKSLIKYPRSGDDEIEETEEVEGEGETVTGYKLVLSSMLSKKDDKSPKSSILVFI